MSNEEIPYGTNTKGPAGTLKHIPYTNLQKEHQAHLCSYLITI